MIPVLKGMNRRKARENAFIAMFSASFGPIRAKEAALGLAEVSDIEMDDFCRSIVEAYDNNMEFIDEKIKKNLRSWSFDRLSKVSVAILRLAIAELFFAGDNPPGVVINEAVELAKQYGDENDFQFVNGVLSVIQKNKEAEDGTD